MAERKVRRRTRVEIICDELVKVDRNRLREVLLAELLVDRHGWPVDETYAAIQRGVDDPEVQMFRTRDNGWTIVFSGTERVAGGGGVGLYQDVETVLVEHWARRRRYVVTSTEVTATGGSRGSGKWSHPDLVMGFDTQGRSRPLDREMLVAFEVETATGFDVRSVYQAYEQGRGTDYSYVVLPRHRTQDPEWARAEAVARELGVGLMTYGKPWLWSTWTTVYRARFRDPRLGERARFKSVALPGEARSDG